MRRLDTKICPVRTLTIYRMMLKNPKRIIISKDLNMGKAGMIHLKFLAALGLFEVVPTVYKCGKNYYVHRSVKGFRLKQR